MGLKVNAFIKTLLLRWKNKEEKEKKKREKGKIQCPSALQTQLTKQDCLWTGCLGPFALKRVLQLEHWLQAKSLVQFAGDQKNKIAEF